MGPEKKAAHLPLNMSDVARKVCFSVGRDIIGNLDGAEQIRVQGRAAALLFLQDLHEELAQVAHRHCALPHFARRRADVAPQGLVIYRATLLCDAPLPV